MGEITCGIVLIRLLEKYGVDTVFGIPGVHTLELCRGLDGSSIQHVQARNEQGAGFMADGFARISGRPGVCMGISGPGVTNALTAIGQAFADSIPVLMISSDAASHTLGKGWGALHEVPCLTDVTAPLTAMSATAMRPDDLPELIGKAFSIFASERPRPVHISIPLDVLAQSTDGDWEPVTLPDRALPNAAQIENAAKLLASAKRPMIYAGGGAVDAGQDLLRLAEALSAPVITSNAGKGSVPDSHPLVLGGGIVRPEIQNFISTADVVLAIGTELAETDSFVERLNITGKVIRVDIDPRKINDLYPADIGIIGDADAAAKALVETRINIEGSDPELSGEVGHLKKQILLDVTESERQHIKCLNVLREVLPAETVIAGDIAQLVYTGSFAFPVEAPRLWHYPAGFCTLGCGLPNGIGGKLALPDAPVLVLAGDGGVMFTIQELVTAAELRLSLPIIIWENGGLKQIQDDMKTAKIPLVGVTGMNPDFTALARSCGCLAVSAETAAQLKAQVKDALVADLPIVITVAEGSDWLL